LEIGAPLQEFEDQNLEAFISFEFVSVNLKTGTAQLNYKSGEGFGYGSAMQEYFTEAVEKRPFSLPGLSRSGFVLTASRITGGSMH
jgi:hypothetical protein